jgi:digeranylgeranylglycerophospholipid reductase
LRPEAAVVGAGPAGILAAKCVAERGFSVQVFEEHPSIGEPSHCAGLVSVEGLRRLGVEPHGSFIQGTVYGGRVYAPNGEHMEIRDRKPRAYVVDRAAFDRRLYGEAVDAGVEFTLSERVEALEFNGGRASLGLRGGIVEPTVIIDAEGPGARLLNEAGHDTGQRGLISGFNVEVEGVEVDPGIVELWFGEDLAEGFFAWVIPTGDDTARCGLASRGDGLSNLKGFLKNRFGVVPPAKVRAGRVCTGGPVQRTVYSNVLLVGDAAGQVKPTTGGGVVLGGLCACIAGDVASEHLSGEEKLSRYDKLWREKYGSEFRSMLALRGLMNGLGDERLNRVLHAFKEEGLQAKAQSLLERGDIDMQAGVIREALTDPAMLAALVRSLGRVALGELLSLV